MTVQRGRGQVHCVRSSKENGSGQAS
ncbi:MAG: hypothetical protein JWM35_185, partial [Verrucomicrobia bacterium]|nr:hypothetical protein [Verrucomicrobiota bacterium]